MLEVNCGHDCLVIIHQVLLERPTDFFFELITEIQHSIFVSSPNIAGEHGVMVGENANDLPASTKLSRLNDKNSIFHQTVFSRIGPRAVDNTFVLHTLMQPMRKPGIHPKEVLSLEGI